MLDMRLRDKASTEQLEIYHKFVSAFQQTIQKGKYNQFHHVYN